MYAAPETTNPSVGNIGAFWEGVSLCYFSFSNYMSLGTIYEKHERNVVSLLKQPGFGHLRACRYENIEFGTKLRSNLR